jgi:hypothetical protein
MVSYNPAVIHQAVTENYRWARWFAKWATPVAVVLAALVALAAVLSGEGIVIAIGLVQAAIVFVVVRYSMLLTAFLLRLAGQLVLSQVEIEANTRGARVRPQPNPEDEEDDVVAAVF